MKSTIIKNYLRKLYESSLMINGTILVIMLISVGIISYPLYLKNPEEFEDQLIYTSYGMIFDIAIIGLLITWLNERRDKKYRIQSYHNEIDDFRSWISEEAMLRIVGNIKRLNKNNITDIDLVDCTLRNINLNNADLSGSNLNSAELSNCSLLGIKLNGCRLNQANFENSNLNSSEFIKSYATGANFSDSYLIKSNFEGAYLIKSDFENAFLIEANLRNSIVSDANFENASLYKADLRGAVGLKAEQLLKVKSLYLTKLDKPIKEKLTEMAPYLINN